MRALTASLFAVVVMFVAVACGDDDPPPPAPVGAACGASGAPDQCVAGGICGKPSDGTTSLQCLVTCKEQADCPAGGDCNGVEGSALKGCRPKSAISDGGADTGKK